MTLRKLREESGFSRAEVAKALGVSVQALGHYENGVRRINIEQVLILSKLLHFTTEDIILSQLNSYH